MKMTIKELKAKGEKDDKIKFTAKVENVYDAKELTPEQKTKAKYTFSRQNVIVNDDTDNIQVIVSHKDKEAEYSKDIIGKEVEIDGKITIWDGKVKTFGKLIFKAGEVPVSKITTVAEKPKGTPAIPVVVEVRKASLKYALEFWTARIGDKMEESKIIRTADKFYLYLTGKANVEEISKQEEEATRKEKEEKIETEKEGDDIKKEEELSAKKVKLINEVMSLKELHHVVEEVFKGYCDRKDIKALTIEELEKIKKTINEQTDEIPF